MTEQLHSGDMPPSRLRRIDELCDRFEAAWRAGQRPRIEECLRESPQEERAQLLGELLPLELVYRLEEYQQRFPDHRELIRAVFAEKLPRELSRTSTDRNLLFGILALQMEFISRDALIAAMHDWVLEKAKPLGQILVDQAHLDPEQLGLLEALVQAHIRVHHNDPQQSLASLSSASSVRQELASVADDDIHRSLQSVGVAAPGATIDVYMPRRPQAGQGLRYRILRPHTHTHQLFAARAALEANQPHTRYLG
jgi:hypothetical protein